MQIVPVEKDLGGFSVRRLLPCAAQKAVGPWVFFDHMGPTVFAPGPGIDVRPHPHIHLATVTYLFEGVMLHRDSLGTEQLIEPGDINLMVAGRGIVHSEREPEAVRQQERHLHGLQLWLALPKADEDSDPAFHHYQGADLPQLTVDGVTVRVLIGQAYGAQSPVKTFAKTLYLEAWMQAGQRLVVPEAQMVACYVIAGSLKQGEVALPAHHMMLLESGTELKAHGDSHVVFIGGDRLSPRHLQWNFVSSDQQAIEKAKRDWAAGLFPQVPGDTTEYIPLPDALLK